MDNGLLVAISTTPMSPGEFTTGGLDGSSPSGSEFNAGKKRFKFKKKPKSTNYVDSDGDTKHGRISCKGKADPAKGTLTVTYEKLGSDGEPLGTDEGEYFQAENVTVGSNCKWSSTAPGAGTTPNLCHGKWRVTVEQDGETITETTTIKLPGN